MSRLSDASVGRVDAGPLEDRRGLLAERVELPAEVPGVSVSRTA